MLHWDGKCLKSLQHAGFDQEAIAVLLTNCTTWKEHMIRIVLIDKDDDVKITSTLQAEKIEETLKQLEINTAKILGLVFDTTSTNSGIHKGIVVQLQQRFDADLLELACRHHIYELLCGAAGSIVYGDTKSRQIHLLGSFRRPG